MLAPERKEELQIAIEEQQEVSVDRLLNIRLIVYCQLKQYLRCMPKCYVASRHMQNVDAVNATTDRDGCMFSLSCK
jgi:hypothetical protein